MVGTGGWVLDTQRGDRRQQTFFCDEDYEAYLAVMAPLFPCHGNRPKPERQWSWF